MQIWPAIDLRGGQCVRLEQGDYGRETVFSSNPAQMAKHWEQAGGERLHLVDLDAARDGEAGNRAAVVEILSAVSIPCELGGGIRDEESIRGWLDAGVTQLVVGTRAVRDPEWFTSMCDRYPHQLALGLDARDGRIATDGWLETSELDAVEFAQRFASSPVAAIIYTDIAKDGMLAGPNFSAVAAMQEAVDLPVVASGGVTTAEDVRRLAEIGVAGCIIGRTLYDGKLSIADAIRAAQSGS